MVKKKKAPYLYEKIAVVLCNQNHVDGDRLTPREFARSVSNGYRINKQDIKSLLKELAEFGIVKRDNQKVTILRSPRLPRS